MLGLQTLRAHPSGKDLHEHGRNHEEAPVGMRGRVIASCGEGSGDRQGQHRLCGNDHDLLVHLIPLSSSPNDRLTLAIPSSAKGVPCSVARKSWGVSHFQSYFTKCGATARATIGEGKPCWPAKGMLDEKVPCPWYFIQTTFVTPCLSLSTGTAQEHKS